MPELVGSVDLKPRSAADDEHDPLTVSTIDSGPLIYALINSVKELAARLAAMEKARD
jgi:hypothetical protein